MNDEISVVFGAPDHIVEAANSYCGKGRKPSARLIEIDNEAIARILSGEFPNVRAAARHFLPKYGFVGSSPEEENNRIKDIAKRLSKKLPK